jgi:hypothetical protein
MMIGRRWRRRGDVKREQMLANALETSHADVTQITLKVLGTTAVLGGYVATSQDRKEIIACVLGYFGIGQVIDSMALPGERPTVTIHLGKERQELRRAMTEFCYRRSGRDVPTYAGTSAGGIGGTGSFAAGVKLGTAMASARRSARRLLSYFVR